MKKFGPYKGYSYPKKSDLGKSGDHTSDHDKEALLEKKPAIKTEPVFYNNKPSLQELGRRYENILARHKKLSEALDVQVNDDN